MFVRAYFQRKLSTFIVSSSRQTVAHYLVFILLCINFVGRSSCQYIMTIIARLSLQVKIYFCFSKEKQNSTKSYEDKSGTSIERSTDLNINVKFQSLEFILLCIICRSKLAIHYYCRIIANKKKKRIFPFLKGIPSNLI